MVRFISLLIAFTAIFTAANPVAACDPTPPQPEYVDCEDLGSGYEFGFRVRGYSNDRYRFTSSYGTLTNGAPRDPDNWVRISGSNGYNFDWASSLGIDAVIVNAGGRSRVIKDAEDKGGHNYHGKTDSRGKPYKITSIEFCYDYELSVEAEAQGTASANTGWEITKAVAVPHQSHFAGETAAFDYTVAVHKTTAGESAFAVLGQVEILNNTPLTANITRIKDRLQPGDLPVSIDCGDIALPFKLSAGKRVTCTFNEMLDQPLEGKYTVEVSTKGDVGGDSTSDEIEWSTREGPGSPVSITVTDTQAAFGGPHSTDADASWAYAVEAACPVDPALYTDGKLTTVIDNTAAIVETGQSATAQALLDCYLPSLSQSYDVSLDVKYTWGIQKTGSMSELVLDLNQYLPVDYTVSLSVLQAVETNPQIAGTVTVTNPNPASDLTGTLTAEPAPGLSVTWEDCTNPVTVPAGGSLTCQYMAVVPESLPGTSTAALSFNSLTVTSTAPYNFDTAVRTAVDECVTVTDDKYGLLGEVCADQEVKQFAYTMDVGGAQVCNPQPFVNTATFTTVDTLTQGASSWKVLLNINCPGSECLNNSLYWVEHAYPGNYDPTWDKIPPSGPSSPFFDTGQTYLQILARVPEMGVEPAEAYYYALGLEYITARLNALNGAPVPAEIVEALISAEPLLDAYDTNRSGVDDAVLEQMNALLQLFASYNSGGLGQDTCCY